MINQQHGFIENKSHQRNLISCYNRETGLMSREAADIHYLDVSLIQQAREMWSR